jgi:hypothetical protein
MGIVGVEFNDAAGSVRVIFYPSMTTSTVIRNRLKEPSLQGHCLTRGQKALKAAKRKLGEARIDG